MKKRKKRSRRQPLTEKHYEAIALLTASGRMRLTRERIARKLRINRRTLYRWEHRSDFRKELRIAIDRKLREEIGPRWRDGAFTAARTGDIAYLERFFNAWESLQSDDVM